MPVTASATTPPPAADATPTDGAPGVRDVEVLILGGGLCGIAAAIGLRREGIDDFVIVERADDLGGTWLHNRYPGCAVDIPAHVYSFSFAPNPEWTRVFPQAPEIHRYLIDVAERFDLFDRCLLGTEVELASWDAAAQRWHVRTSGGEFRARAIVVAAGPLHEAVTPDFPGLDRFRGETFHSSTWPQDLDLTGRRVVAIGTGASAVQYVPEIQPLVERLTVLQRTPSWVLPKPDGPTSARQRRLLRRFPVLARVLRYAMWAPMDALFVLTVRHPRLARLGGLFGRLHLRRVVRDPQTRAALTPDYAVTCKRLGLSNDYLQSFNHDNVELVPSAAAEIREDGVLTADGRLIPADTIIFGTGFRTLPHHPVNERIVGADGRSLDETWNGRPAAYLGTTVSGFPNAFTMFGANIGTLSGFVMAEAQTDYLVGALRELRARRLGSLDVRPEVQQAFVEEVDAATRTSTFTTGGCSSYYLDDDGRVALVWPWTMARMRRRLARFDPAAYTATADVAAPARR